MQILKAVPTNIITGFLGAGKTTAINHLLAHKPATERWAVLVNEFGQIGVDQSLISATDDVQIREIAGGCLCCAQGPMLRVALTRLLRDIRPHRLLIEPTGLGHPVGVIDLLQSPGFASAIDLRSTLCLLDPRVLEQPKVLSHPVFHDQLTLADIIVLNKTDLASAAQLTEAEALSQNMFPAKAAVVHARHGNIELALLDRVRQHPTAQPALATPVTTPDSGVERNETESIGNLPQPGQPRREQSESDGIHSLGWQFHPDDRFDTEASFALLDALPDAVRVKAALRIGHAWVGYNRIFDDRQVSELAWRRDSRLEILSTGVLDAEMLETRLLRCLRSKQQKTQQSHA